MRRKLAQSVVLFGSLVFCVTARAQLPGSSPAPVGPRQDKPVDILGRSTPRGTVLGFLRAARKEDYDAAAQYLNTRLRGKAAATLAQQLFVVLDRRLPPRLNQLSDRPEGSLAFLTRPDQDLVGTISSDEGNVDIVLEKVPQEQNGAVWLFSRSTLDFVPNLFAEVSAVSVEQSLPSFLTDLRIAHIALYNWLALLLGLPLLYLLTTMLSRTVSAWIGHVRRNRRKDPSLPDPVFLPPPVRLLLVALAVRWALSQVALPLMARQFWSGVAALISIAGCVWLLILVNDWAEAAVGRRLERRNRTGAKSVLRLGRRTIDLLVIFIGLLVSLWHFGINVNTALAGLGVGGIAVALAAQKTLENVIGGISITFDQAVRVGDWLNVGTANGDVEYVGLRSTRIRTLDRTVISVPNGQLANVQLETLSARDKFWFHPNLGLRYETTAAQLCSVTTRTADMLSQRSFVDRGSVRVRFLRFGPSSLDIDISAYVFAQSWPHFLEVQEALLLEIMEIVESSGSKIALPSRTAYLAADSVAGRVAFMSALIPEGKKTIMDSGQ